jgi:hypothetical protein
MRIMLALCLLAGITLAADFSGNWQLEVTLDSGGQGTPAFALKQTANKLAGTYKGPMGEQKVSGTVSGNKAEFWFEVDRDGGKMKATYTATVDSANKLTGTVKFTQDGADAGGGKFTGVKK